MSAKRYKTLDNITFTEEYNKNLTQIDCKPSPICLRAIALSLSLDVLFRGRLALSL